MKNNFLFLGVSLLIFSCGFIEKINPAIKKKDDLDEKRTYKEINCSASTIRKIDRPIDPQDPNSKTFSYSYEFIVGTDPSKTLIAIPGGPGQTSIGSAVGYAGPLMGQYNVIATDPRGVGCNYNESVFTSQTTVNSQRVAEDVLAIVQKENLRDYSVYGISYGTLVATMVASLAESRSDLRPPVSVILEGVFGKAPDNYKVVNGAYEAQWKKILDRNPGAELAFSQTQLPLNLSSISWRKIISNLLMVGTILAKDPKTTLLRKINLLEGVVKRSISDNEDERKMARDYVTSHYGSSPAMKTPGENIFYSVVACTEVFLDLREATFIYGATLNHSTTNLCADYRTKTGMTLNKFDSAQWPISKSTLYYFNGENDPATPIENAVYHYDNQKTAKQKSFVKVLGAGHNPIHLSMDDCLEGLLKGMMNAQNVSSLTSTCAWQNFEIKIEASKVQI